MKRRTRDMETKHIKITDKVDIHESVAWYAYEERLGPAHYGEFPIATDEKAFDSDSNTSATLESFKNYLDNGVISIIRNNRHDFLMGGFLISSIGPVEGVTQPEAGFRFLIGRSKGWSCECDSYCTDGCGILADFPIGRDDRQDDIIERAARHSDLARDILETAVDLRAQGDDGIETVKAADGSEVEIEYDRDGDHLEGISFLQTVALNPEDTQWWSYQTFPYWASTRHQGTTGNVKNAGRKQLLAAYHNYDNRLKAIEGNNSSDPNNVTGEEGIEVLGPSQIETLTTEFLRDEDVGPDYDRYQHVNPGGGRLKGADTLARTADGTRVATQVTMDGAIDKKFRKLASYAAEQSDPSMVDLWYFSKGVEQDDLPEEIEVDIKIKSLEDVFKKMADSVCLNAMLEVPDPEGEPKDII